jgi:hypothetical protein
MLDDADDVAAWLWNDQKGVGYRIQYSFEGRTPYYYPDFLVRLADGSLYIIESKGSIRERDRAKQARAARYADILREATRADWRYLFLVNDGQHRAAGRVVVADAGPHPLPRPRAPHRKRRPRVAAVARCSNCPLFLGERRRNGCRRGVGFG